MSPFQHDTKCQSLRMPHSIPKLTLLLLYSRCNTAPVFIPGSQGMAALGRHWATSSVQPERDKLASICMHCTVTCKGDSECTAVWTGVDTGLKAGLEASWQQSCKTLTCRTAQPLGVNSVAVSAAVTLPGRTRVEMASPGPQTCGDLLGPQSRNLLQHIL